MNNQRKLALCDSLIFHLHQSLTAINIVAEAIDTNPLFTSQLELLINVQESANVLISKVIKSMAFVFNNALR